MLLCIGSSRNSFLKQTLVLANFIFIIYSNRNYADKYIMPIGIPNPGFGIEDAPPSAPSNWSSEIPGYYYIDWSIGQDAGRVFGTPKMPRKTIPQNLSPGSRVELHGNYSQVAGGITILSSNANGEEWEANKSGPAWIIKGDGDTMPCFTFKTVVKGSYLYIDRIKFEKSRLQIGSVSEGYSADHVILKNSIIHGDGIKGTVTPGFSVVSHAKHPVHDIIAFNNLMYDFGDTNSTTDEDCCPMVVSGYNTYNVWILSNHLHTASGSGLRSGNGPNDDPSLVHHIYAGKNHVHNLRQAGLAIKTAQDVIYSQNVCYNIINTDWSAAKGIGGQYQPVRFWVIFNELFNVRYGVIINSTTTNAYAPIYIIGNVIYDIKSLSEDFAGGCWAEAGIHAHGGSEIHIVNNTIARCVTGISITNPKPITIENNIIFNITSMNGVFICIQNPTSNLNIKHNIMFNDGLNSNLVSVDNKIYSSLSQFKIGFPNEKNTLVQNPAFIDSKNNDFQISDTGSAYNAGLTDSDLSFDVYSEFEKLYGKSIRYDFNGNIRPINEEWDIGAYEFGNYKSLPKSPAKMRVYK